MTTAAIDDPLALERQVCFALAVANRAILSVYRPVLAPLGLTHPQYLVMLALWGKSLGAPPTSGDDELASLGRGGMSVKELGQALQLDSATLSPLLKRLEANGLVTRTRNAEDERQLDIELTDQGRELRSQALSVPGHVVARLDADWAELVELHQVLTKINEKAIKAGALQI